MCHYVWKTMETPCSPPIEGSVILNQSLCRPSPATACIAQNQYQHLVVTSPLTHNMIFPILAA